MFGLLRKLLCRLFCGDCLSKVDAKEILQRLDKAIEEVEKIAGG
jgi:hypothetical protein